MDGETRIISSDCESRNDGHISNSLPCHTSVRKINYYNRITRDCLIPPDMTRTRIVTITLAAVVTMLLSRISGQSILNAISRLWKQLLIFLEMKTPYFPAHSEAQFVLSLVIMT